MARFVVHLRPLVTVEINAHDPKQAAVYARDRLLGLLRETPPEIQSIGYMPDSVWETFDSERNLCAWGTDNDLSPRPRPKVSDHAYRGDGDEPCRYRWRAESDKVDCERSAAEHE